MLRLPPSLITLSPMEVHDFCARQKVKLRAAQPSASSGLPIRLRKDDQARRYKQSRSAQIASENNVTEALTGALEIQRAGGSDEFMSGVEGSLLDTDPLLGQPGQGVDSHMQEAFEDSASDWHGSNYHTLAQSSTEESTIDAEDSREELSLPIHPRGTNSCEDDDQSLNSDPSNDQENTHQFLPVSQDGAEEVDNERRGQQTSYSPSKHRFDYGGFVESHTPDSSSFMPEDSSTPAPPAANEVQRLRLRLPLPRSPLHISELVAISPERSHLHNLAPRISSYAAPSLLLAQPPRRTPKAYRPRTVSYSYDESERTSAEEPHANASNNDELSFDQVQSGQQSTSYEELSQSSFNSERSVVDRSTSPPGPVIIHNTEVQRTFYFSSPPLPGELPPPFSTVPRKTSIAASIPSTHSLDGYKSDESSGILVEDNPIQPHRNEAAESTQSVHRSGGTLNRIGRIFSGRFKSRSPMNSPEPSSPKTNSSPTTPRQSVEKSNSSPSPNATPKHSLRVYDDSLPSYSQPQTPAQLPESRHRSRLHPSYTAPVIRRGPGIFGASPHSSMRIPDSASRIRRTAGRSDSPMGMGGERGEGFRGLYGGQENADDDLLFENAARRLWDTGRAGSARRRGSDATPERELTIADMRREHP